MDGIIVDTCGESDLLNKDQLVESDDEDDDSDFEDTGLNPSKIKKIIDNSTKSKKFDPSKDIDLDDFEAEMGWSDKKSKPGSKDYIKEFADQLYIENPISKDFEIDTINISKKKQKAIRRREREKTKGKNWFNMPAPEITPEIKNSLEIIKMRSALDPKRFYKKNDMQALPKYFQMGKVVDTPLDYYNGRLTKKERKATLVDELMADAEFSRYNKRKFKEILDEKRKHNFKAYKHAKRLKVNKNN